MKIRVILTLALILLLIPSASAGVGIVYNTRNLDVQEGQEACITYGAYNPFSTDVNAKIFATGDLTQLISKQEKFEISAGTTHDEAKQVEFCFNVPHVYERNCLAFGMFCNKQCPSETKIYSGDIVVQESSEGTSGTGSSAASSASAKLNVNVVCTPQKRNYFALSGLIIAFVAAIAVAGFFIYKRTPSAKDRKKKQYQKQLKKLNDLKKDLKK